MQRVRYMVFEIQMIYAMVPRNWKVYSYVDHHLSSESKIQMIRSWKRKTSNVTIWEDILPMRVAKNATKPFKNLTSIPSEIGYCICKVKKIVVINAIFKSLTRVTVIIRTTRFLMVEENRVIIPNQTPWRIKL